MKMKCSFLVILAALTFLYSCKKEDTAESYMRGGNSITGTPDGGMLIAGFNYSESGNYDGYLTKVTSNGDVVWGNFYGGIYTDGLYKVITATGGGYVATGFSSFTYDNVTQMIILKVKESGEKEWLVNFGGDATTQGFSVTETADGGFIACGYIQDSYDTDRDIYLVKVNGSGEKVWEKRYGASTPVSTTYDEAYAIIPSGDTAFYLTGSLNGKVSCCGSAFLMKISAAGDSLWTKSYETGLGYSLASTTTGDIVISGMTESNSQDVLVIRTTAEGEKLWSQPSGSSDGFDYGTSLVLTQDGGAVVTGISSPKGSANQDILLKKFSAEGTLVWSKSYGGSDVDQGIGLLMHEDGGFSITGLSNSGGSYIYLNRTNSEGVESWQKNIK